MNLRIKKGLDLHLMGAVADTAAVTKVEAAECAIIPDDFHGFVPKLEVREGDHVKAGEPLLRHKTFEQMKVAAPVSGTVKEVVRGERRKILRVVIAADGTEKARLESPMPTTRAGALELLCRWGLLARMRQRPYDIVPRPDVSPRDIFVTAIDSAPLAAPMTLALGTDPAPLAKAVQLLRLVTDGKVYIAVDKNWTLGAIPGAEMVEVEGPHPAGNPGVHIAAIAPVNKGETVWTLDAVTLYKTGRLLTDGTPDTSALVAVTGSEVTKPYMALTTEGAQIKPLVEGRLAQGHLRIISGNVLTGHAEDADSFLRFPYRQITVIPEGDDVAEFMGWASMSPSKMSVSRSFPGHFLSRLFRPDARVKGGRRAMIMSGEYDNVMPMDILPEYLLKAIIARDIDAMEKLGIYEVAPEDFALAEYVDTSKQPLQQIVRDGLDYLRKELE